MLGKKVKYRIFYLLTSFILLALVIFFVFDSLEENVVYFFSPTDIKQKNEILYDEKIRVGGLVKEGSINKKNTTINFIITDLKNEIARVVKSGGKVISFGWNSGGIGKKNGFDIERILLVPHGGPHNDTIVTVDIKR